MPGSLLPCSKNLQNLSIQRLNTTFLYLPDVHNQGLVVTSQLDESFHSFKRPRVTVTNRVNVRKFAFKGLTKSSIKSSNCNVVDDVCVYSLLRDLHSPVEAKT